MDRNAILSGYITSFSSYSSSDSRPTAEKVLKFSGSNLDIRRRGDIITEVVVFKLLGGSTDVLVDADKPTELTQNFEAIVYIEQANTHSGKDTSYDRMLELTDQLIDWADTTVATTITSDVYTIQLTGVDSIDEDNGFLSTNVNFQSIIKIS
tara:strand:+ start:711 stop:1166 length:456 start_codon:yes stop_codon:yes gene_type:complete